MFYSDKPIFSSDSDLLNRGEFSEQLAKAIVSYTEIENFTIGLTGKWGCGKTSIINMMVQKIEELSKKVPFDERPIIIKFNPWNYCDRNQLLSQFFKTILLEIEEKDKNGMLKSVGDAIRKYSSVFEYTTYIPVIGQYLGPLKSLIEATGEHISEFAHEESSLSKQRDTVKKALQAQKRKLIIIIDDIDRLNNEQIRLIFQLVNTVAGFPNIIYVLSYDKDVVTRALESEQNFRGEEYLEKIVQVVFEVPLVDKMSIHDIFLKNLIDIFNEKSREETLLFSRLNTICQTCVFPFLNSIRDLNRLLNLYKFKIGFMYDETNAVDLLAITSLQIFAPGIYDWIKEEYSRLTGNSYSQKEPEERININKNKYLLEFKEAYPDSPELMLRSVQAIFPNFSWRTGGAYRETDTEENLRYEKRIASPERSKYYFSLSLNDIVITQKQIKETILNYSELELRNYFEKLCENKKLSYYLQELKAHKEIIREERIPLLLNELIYQQTKRKSFLEKYHNPPSAVRECFKTCMYLLSTLDDGGTLYLQSAISQANEGTLPVLVYIVLNIEMLFNRISGLDYLSIKYNHRAMGKENLKTIEKCILAKMRSIYTDKNLFDSANIKSIYTLWNFLEKDSFDYYIKMQLQKPENIIKYLYSVEKRTAHEDKIGDWIFESDIYFKYINIDEAYSKIQSLVLNKELAFLEHELRDAASAYCLWYESGRRDNDIVAKERVERRVLNWEEQWRS